MTLENMGIFAFFDMIRKPKMPVNQRFTGIFNFKTLGGRKTGLEPCS
jgi:hypothetical protein